MILIWGCFGFIFDLKKEIVMARLSKNSVVHGCNGSIGGLVFRSYGGETYISEKPTFRKKRKQSALQQANRDKFRKAQAYAGEAMRDAELKAYYLKKAKELKLPNARTAAVTEYMRGIQVDKVDAKRYTGKAGDRIGISARKQGFNQIEAVEVIVHNAAGEVIEQGNAYKTSTVDWVYRATMTDVGYKKVIVNVKDRTGQIASCISYF